MRNVDFDLPDWMIERITTKFSKRYFILTSAFRLTTSVISGLSILGPQSRLSLLTRGALAQGKNSGSGETCDFL